MKPPAQGCVICGQEITPFDTYGVGALARYHWDCIRKEAATVSPAQGWVMLSTRPPIKEDANDLGRVLWRNE